MAEAEVSHPARRWIAIAAGVLVVIALVIWAVQYLLVGQYFVSTDDAYLQADSAVIAPKIEGYVDAVLVNDNQPVRRGQLLIRIDGRDYQNALTAAQADIQAAQASLQSDQAQLDLQQAKISQAAAQVKADQARLQFAYSDQRRYAAASANGASTRQSATQADTSVQTAQAMLEADQAALLGTQRQIAVLDAAAAQSQASLAQATSRAQQASLNLSHTDVTAPFDGVVGNKTVVPGDYVTPGTQIMAVVPLNAVYVTANYKETQITGIIPGQHVTIGVDSFPSLKVTGTVDSIAPSSGQEFALLPPDNATGNFTKIVQRVPVKIVLNLNNDLIGKLRPGMSVEPDIDTRGR